MIIERSLCLLRYTANGVFFLYFFFLMFKIRLILEVLGVVKVKATTIFCILKMDMKAVAIAKSRRLRVDIRERWYSSESLYTIPFNSI